jgi:glycolate oxidase
MLDNQIVKQLQEIVGKERFLNSIEDRISYSYDGTALISSLPEAVVIPRSTEEISRVLKLANEKIFSVVPRGSGTGLSGGSIPLENSVVLLMNRWNKILEIDQANLTAWVEPGVITGNLQSIVESLGLMYPPDPGSSQICTIGGNVAENAGGLRGLKYGVTKNYVLGLEMVLPTGEIMQVGGKNVKDVAGYNLKDIMIGSEGTLGVFTKILLKLIPKPQTSKTILAFFDSMAGAAEAVAAIIANKILPSMLEFLDNLTIRAVNDFAKLGLDTDANALLLIEVDGPQSIVTDESSAIESICKKIGSKSLIAARDENQATKLKAARKSAFAALARIRPTTILEDATVPRSAVPKLVEFINRTAQKYNVQIGTFGHAGDGNMHPTGLTDERDNEELNRIKSAFDEIFEEAMSLGGTITGEHGVGLAKKEFMEKLYNTPFIELMKKTKVMLDPNLVLNPNKIVSVAPRCEGALPKNKEQIKRFGEMYF